MTTSDSAPAASSAIELTDLSYTYQGNPAPVLDIPAWRVARNEHVFLQGESGSGKSTLLSLLAGLLLPTRGDVTVLGTSLSTLGNRKRDRFRAANLGVVFQQFNLIPYLSALDNVVLAARFAKQSGTDAQTQDAKTRATQLLERVNLTPALHQRKAAELSIGQQQRVAIVRALMNTPSVLLVDEPTSALDHANRDAFLALLFEVLADLECAMLFVSHDPGIGLNFDQQMKLTELNQAAGPK